MTPTPETLKEVEAALVSCVARGHADTCSSELITDASYPCDCGHNQTKAALARLRAETPAGKD